MEVREGIVLGRLGLSVIALEAELLAGPTFGSLLITSLLTTTASVTSLERGQILTGQRSGGHTGPSRPLTCAAIAPRSFLRLAAVEAADSAKGLAVELLGPMDDGMVWEVGVAGRSAIFFGGRLPARGAVLRLLADKARGSLSEVRLRLPG